MSFGAKQGEHLGSAPLFVGRQSCQTSGYRSVNTKFSRWLGSNHIDLFRFVFISIMLLYVSQIDLMRSHSICVYVF